MWDKLEASLRETGEAFHLRPKAILVISAHWDAAVPTVLNADRHHLYFDYSGFPKSTYELKYPAVGDAALAKRVRDLLSHACIASAEQTDRGLDHGVFVPFLIMFPKADIPIVQLSLRTDMDPDAHLAIGRALAPLRDEGVLIIGSGSSYHNLRQLMSSGSAEHAAREFDDWLFETMTNPDQTQRDAKLAAWYTAPSALACHPTPDHLIPYHVVAGAALDDVGEQIFRGEIMGKVTSSYRFGEQPQTQEQTR
jgi:aromatic ring-opening dioxygenase catalytic subunit (LigB family)